MDERLQQLRDKINALSLRERVITLLVVIAALFFLFDLLWLGSAMDKRSGMSKRLDTKLASVQQLESQLSSLQSEASTASEQLAQQKALLSRRLAELDEKIAEAAQGFIPAQLMPKVLEEILAQQKGLSLVSLANIPPVPHSESADQTNDAAKAAALAQNQALQQNLIEAEQANQEDTLYKHGVELRVKGDYRAIVSYLEKLETMRWFLHWHALEYTIEEYPVGELGLQVYTYSMDKEWLGV